MTLIHRWSQILLPVFSNLFLWFFTKFLFKRCGSGSKISYTSIPVFMSSITEFSNIFSVLRYLKYLFNRNMHFVLPNSVYIYIYCLLTDMTLYWKQGNVLWLIVSWIFVTKYFLRFSSPQTLCSLSRTIFGLPCAIYISFLKNWNFCIHHTMFCFIAGK